MTLPLIVVAPGRERHAWTEAARGHSGFTLVASLDLESSSIEGLREVAHSHPESAFAAGARGPLEASRLAAMLDRRLGPTLLHPRPSHPPAGASIQIAHGWLSLSLLPTFVDFVGEAQPDRISIQARGVPHITTESAAPLVETVFYALAIVHQIAPTFELVRAELVDEAHLHAVFAEGEREVVVDMFRDGEGIEFRSDVHDRQVCLRAQAGHEELVGIASNPQRRHLPAWEHRSLDQLLAPIPGASIADARVANLSLERVQRTLGRAFPPPPPAIADLRPRDSNTWFESVGLEGEPPAAKRLAEPPRLMEPTLSSPYLLDTLAFGAGLKHAIWLTLPPTAPLAELEALGGFMVRSSAAESARANVEVCIARRRHVAEELHRTIHEERMSEPARRKKIGTLLGYPSCCVEAYSRQRHAPLAGYDQLAVAARTQEANWPALLNNTMFSLLSHVPCTYTCQPSVQMAEAMYRLLSRRERNLARTCLGALSGPVLYFGPNDRIHFDATGPATASEITYRGLYVSAGADDELALLAGAMLEGELLELEASSLTVRRGTTTVAELRRVEPAAGRIFPFRSIQGGVP